MGPIPHISKLLLQYWKILVKIEMKIKFTKVAILELFDTVGHFNWYNWVHNKDNKKKERNNFRSLSISKNICFHNQKMAQKDFEFFV